MADQEHVFSRIFARVRVAFTSLGKDNLPIANVTGLEQDIGLRETVHGVPIYGAVGLFARPKPPTQITGEACAGFGVRVGDVILPIAMIDKRIASALGALPDLAIALGGYLGQRVVLDSQGAGKIVIQHGALSITLDGNPAPTPTITLAFGATTIILDGTTVKITGAVTVNGVPLAVP